MKLHQQRHGAVTLLKPDGPISESAVVEFERALRELLGSNLGRVVVDMSEVPFIDSKGLEALLDISDTLGDSGQALKLCAVNKTVRQIFELTELDSNFDHFDTINSAVRSFL